MRAYSIFRGLALFIFLLLVFSLFLVAGLAQGLSAPAAPDVADNLLRCPNALFVIPSEGKIGPGFRYPGGPRPSDVQTGIGILGNPTDPVVAAYGGVLQHVHRERGSDTVVGVTIRHDDLNVETYYGHLRSYDIPLVPGTRIGEGQLIGYKGNVGAPDGLVNLRFAVTRPNQDQRYIRNVYDPSSYLGANVNFVDGDVPYDQYTVLEKCSLSEGEHVSVALILDATGSMSGSDPQGLRKAAAKAFVDAAETGDRIAIVAFDYRGFRFAPLTEITGPADRQTLKAAIDRVFDGGSTDLNLGLNLGFQELLSDTSANRKAAVFLTDGWHNVGPYRDNSHLQYAAREWPVYTIGLSTSADADLLRRIADETGGRFRFLLRAEDLQAVYFEIAQRIAQRRVVDQRTVPVAPGQEQVINLNVPLTQREASVFVGWPNPRSRIEATLIDPRGRVIDSNTRTPDITYNSSDTSAVYTLYHPAPGSWRLRLQGRELPSGTEFVAVRASVQGKQYHYLPTLLNQFDTALLPPPRVNDPPGAPGSPFPADTVGDVDPSAIALEWAATDPNGDDLTFDVYFGTSNPPPLVAADQAGPVHYRSLLQENRTYYWKVVSRDIDGAEQAGPLWQFTTGANPQPPPVTPTPTPTASPTPSNPPVDGDWKPLGTAAASGGGISTNAGSSTLPSLVEAPDGTIYVAWGDTSSGDEEIYARRWNGSSWSEAGSGSAAGGGISQNGGTSRTPMIASAPDGTIYLVWDDNSSGDYEIYVRRWNGSSWGEVGTGSATGGGISNNTGDSISAKIRIAPDGSPHICWIDKSPGDWEIYIRRWNGSAWVEVGSGSATGGGVSNNAGDSRSCTLGFAPDGSPYVGWRDATTGDDEIYVRHWNGSNWNELGPGSASGGGISNNSGHSGNPRLLVSPSGLLNVFWQDATPGNYEIYMKQWNGASWYELGGSASGGGISKSSGLSAGSSPLTLPDGNPAIAWHDNTTGNYEIYVRYWNGSAWQPLGSGAASGGGISQNGGNSEKPSLALTAGNLPAIAWYDSSSGNNEIYVKRLE